MIEIFIMYFHLSTDNPRQQVSSRVGKEGGVVGETYHKTGVLETSWRRVELVVTITLLNNSTHCHYFIVACLLELETSLLRERADLFIYLEKSRVHLCK